jgi:hypothetical protein
MITDTRNGSTFYLLTPGVSWGESAKHEVEPKLSPTTIHQLIQESNCWGLEFHSGSRVQYHKYTRGGLCCPS